jgi:hypothetical protein
MYFENLIKRLLILVFLFLSEVHCYSQLVELNICELRNYNTVELDTFKNNALKIGFAIPEGFEYVKLGSEYQVIGKKPTEVKKFSFLSVFIQKDVERDSNKMIIIGAIIKSRSEPEHLSIKGLATDFNRIKDLHLIYQENKAYQNLKINDEWWYKFKFYSFDETNNKNYSNLFLRFYNERVILMYWELSDYESINNYIDLFVIHEHDYLIKLKKAKKKTYCESYF